MARKIIMGSLMLFFVLALIMSTSAYAAIDELLAQYETGDKEFVKKEIADAIVFHHQRMIDEAIVEGDQIIYLFDKETKELRDKAVRWRDDLPEHVTYNITKENAEKMVSGEISFSHLFIVPLDPKLYPIPAMPYNPCWKIAVEEDGYIHLKIIDAVTGEYLGEGPPLPYTSLSCDGPISAHPCEQGVTWAYYADLARNSFNLLDTKEGDNCDRLTFPTKSQIENQIKNYETAMIYLFGHSGDDQSWKIATGCDNGDFEWTTVFDIQDWIEDYPKMPFTFLASCRNMCSTGPGTLSYAFRKGSNEATVTVGYCRMDLGDCHEYCWPTGAQLWQMDFFSRLVYGYTVGEAFDYANCYNPSCPDCFQIAGDLSMTAPFERYHCPDEAAYEYLPGDANMWWGEWKPVLNNADVTYLANFFRGTSWACYLDGFYASADANGSCAVIGNDLTYLVNVLRGLYKIKWCPNYDTKWPMPICIPDDQPPNWPACE
jgi:hypothetical protein